MEVVWFKKDLRVTDHQALWQARQRGPVLGLFVVEPSWLSSAEFSTRHLNFALQSLRELKINLERLGIPLWVAHQEIIPCLHSLRQQFAFKRLYSHQETGLLWTFQRDLQVKGWCREQGVEWHEYRQFAVVRPLKSRDLWNKKRGKIIERAEVPEPPVQLSPQWSCPWPQFPLAEDAKDTGAIIFRGGSSQAQKSLADFLRQRLPTYQKGMSSPLTGVESCSLLSPHITWGCLSLTQIHHQVQRRRDQLRADFDELSFKAPSSERRQLLGAAWKGLKAFESRLWWHCHFIQKLEDEPRLESMPMNKAFTELRRAEFDETKFQAWATGETGYPFIDACMRSLQQTGWLNFRMRAMLVSFAAYQLWLDWPRLGQHLARLFVDFEPGIHYSQMQMQSGVTGINAIRIYSPIKQSQDQDPSGEFILRYVPELAHLNAASVHWPHDLPPLLKGLSSSSSYPEPIVDPKESYRLAKERIYKFRGQAEVRASSRQVYLKHGSRKNRFFPSQKRSP
jgi:deoxyribodipyrimidine photo-lyase